VDIDTLFNFYKSDFIPAYSDLVGYIGDKPQQVLIELENILSHLSQYFDSGITLQDRQINIQKAYDHLHRVTLDCYKLLWISIYNRLEEIEKDKSTRRLGLNMSEAEFLSRMQRIRKLAQGARRKELESVGLNPMASLDLYKEVVKEEYEILSSIDQNKMQEIRSLKRFITTKEFIVGIITGLVSGYILSLVTTIFSII